MNSNSSYRKPWEILIFFYKIYVRMWVSFPPSPFFPVEWLALLKGTEFFPHVFKDILNLLHLGFPWYEHKSTIIWLSWRCKYSWPGNVFYLFYITKWKCSFDFCKEKASESNFILPNESTSFYTSQEFH